MSGEPGVEATASASDHTTTVSEPAYGTVALLFAGMTVRGVARGTRAYLKAWADKMPHMTLTAGMGLLVGMLWMLSVRGGPVEARATAFDNVQEAALVQETCDAVAEGSMAKTVGGEWGCYDPQTGELKSKIYGDSAPVVPTQESAAPSWGGAPVVAGVRRWAAEIEAAAERHGVDPRLVACMMTIESKGNPEAHSPAGADGLMQVVKDPWHPTYDIARGRREPAYAVDYGVEFLASLIKSTGSIRTAVCQYNGGGNCALYQESRDYMAFVLPCAGVA